MSGTIIIIPKEHFTSPITLGAWRRFVHDNLSLFSRQTFHPVGSVYCDLGLFKKTKGRVFYTASPTLLRTSSQFKDYTQIIATPAQAMFLITGKKNFDITA